MNQQVSRATELGLDIRQGSDTTEQNAGATLPDELNS